jgi:salicylate hydroxylase
MAELLADPAVDSTKDIEKAFAIFDATRRERGHWLVQSSRFTGDCYEWRAEGVGRDFKKIEDEINRRNAIIADFDIESSCRRAKIQLTPS